MACSQSSEAQATGLLLTKMMRAQCLCAVQQSERGAAISERASEKGQPSRRHIDRIIAKNKSKKKNMSAKETKRELDL